VLIKLKIKFLKGESIGKKESKFLFFSEAYLNGSSCPSKHKFHLHTIP